MQSKFNYADDKCVSNVEEFIKCFYEGYSPFVLVLPDVEQAVAELRSRRTESDDMEFLYAIVARKSDDEALCEEGMKILDRLCEREHTYAQCALGNILLNNYSTNGVTADIDRAERLLSASARKGCQQAMFVYALLLVSKGTQQALGQTYELFSVLAQEGNPFAQFYLGTMYRDGLGVEKNQTKAIKWICAAADNDHSEAQFVFGIYCINGEIVPKDVDKGLALLERSAQQGFCNAMVMLGYYYCSGMDGVKADFDRGVKNFHLAATNGSAQAMFELGCIYHNEENYADAEKARNYLCEALQSEYWEAAMELASLYEEGFGFAQDYEQAVKMYSVAKDHGIEGAARELERLRENHCPHCGAYYSATIKRNLLGTVKVCGKCGKRM